MVIGIRVILNFKEINLGFEDAQLRGKLFGVWTHKLHT